jgi:hypothetical protein
LQIGWLCKRTGGVPDATYPLFVLTLEFLKELGYGNISTAPFEKIQPVYINTDEGENQ